MPSDFEKPRSKKVGAVSGTIPTAADQKISVLETQVELLRQERGGLVEIIQRFEQREQQWEQREQQWEQRWQVLLGQLDQMKQREQQWGAEHAQLSSQIAK